MALLLTLTLVFLILACVATMQHRAEESGVQKIRDMMRRDEKRFVMDLNSFRDSNPSLCKKCVWIRWAEPSIASTDPPPLLYPCTDSLKLRTISGFLL